MKLEQLNTFLAKDDSNKSSFAYCRILTHASAGLDHLYIHGDYAYDLHAIAADLTEAGYKCEYTPRYRGMRDHIKVSGWNKTKHHNVSDY